MSEPTARAPMQWGLSTRCRRGELMNGDLGVISALPNGVLFAAFDGLGHGREAAHAAQAAGEVVREGPSDDLVQLAKHCHDALRDTRGAAATLAFMSHRTHTMTWLGVGNVEGRVLSGDPSALRPKGSLSPVHGILGHELPSAAVATLDLRPGDVMVLATDGIDGAFGDLLDTSGSPQDITERILAVHWKPLDDALVVAVRYLGTWS